MTAPPIAAETTAARTRASASGVAAGQHDVQTMHQLPERFVLREEPDDDGIVLDRAHHAAALDREVDHLGEHQLARTRRDLLGFGRVERRFQLHEVDLDGRERRSRPWS